MSMEKTVSLVKARVRGSGTLVVVIPKEARVKLGIKKGKKFLVKVDRTDESYKLIYEPVE